ncbi:molybdate ABC transporter substrate-binding protein [Psychrosphaera sp. B3R10]|uniref:molybdate ABC transporter substrate-binding protein n=1 Tax=unclassified Psychrosphaera TaxID=2641570 RepID=UPI001C0A419D|nr:MULTISPECIES: molybdate ABC transporter substrate-binding protein [unclassified Psychrosphaera]MBU2883497.1 molybdate ABC transporter substrate-binding protein [Psychrosphaera sp. I2R16]MBU2989676.1 molybdate ABC transporter substrate-binding protein [Psychrosphaera sp. B3R10]
MIVKIIATLWFVLSLPTYAATLNVAVATNFYHVMSELKTEFEKNQPHKLQISSGSSGIIFSQISNGAPYDVFLSADSERPRKLIADNLAYKNSLKTYAVGELIWWQPNTKHMTLDTLKNYNTKLAIANPRLAPYGQAAIAVLKQLNLRKPVQLVKGMNVGQAFQYVDSGNVQAGLVAKSSVVNGYNRFADPKYLNYITLRADWYPEIEQQLVILKRTAEVQLAQTFVTFMLSTDTQKRLRELGYKTKINE